MNTKEDTIGYDIISILSFFSTILAIIASLFYPAILQQYFWQIITIASLVTLTIIIMFFKRNIEGNRKEVEKLKERMNIQDQLIDLKSKVEYLMQMKDKRGKEDFLEIIIRIIQIGAIIFAAYIIFKAFSSI